MSDLHQLRALCPSVANGEPHAEVRLVECVLSLPLDEYPVNYPRLKPGACPWRYATNRVSETFGGLTAARRIFSAAM